MSDMNFAITEVRNNQELKDLLSTRTSGEPLLALNRQRTIGQQFANQMRAAQGLASDFDNTLIMGNEWNDVRELLHPQLADQDRAELKTWASRPRTVEGESQYIFRSVDRMVRSNVSAPKLAAKAIAQKPRAGSLELISSFGDFACAISFGLFDYIEAWATYHGINLAIEALHLDWYDNGQLKGYHEETVVVSRNKRLSADNFRVRTVLDPEEILFLGDTPSDVEFFNRRGICVLIVPHTETEEAIAKYRMEGIPQHWDELDAVVIGDELTPLAAMRI